LLSAGDTESDSDYLTTKLILRFARIR